MENFPIYWLLETPSTPIYSQCLSDFPRYGNTGFSGSVVDKSVDGLRGFYPQEKQLEKQDPTSYSERSGVYIPYMVVFRISPQYPHPLLLLLNH